MLLKIYLNYVTLPFVERLWRISGKRINFEVVTSREMTLKMIGRPNFKCAKIFREDLAGIHMAKPVLAMNRPIQVGLLFLTFQNISCMISIIIRG